MPKKLLATTIIIATILALVIGILVVEVADANPMGPGPYSPTEPIKDPPTIIINTPTNTTYLQNLIPINITIIQPDSWETTTNINDTGTRLLDTNTLRIVSCEVDGKSFTLWNGTRWQLIGTSYTVDYTLPKNSQFTATMNISNGQHRLQVNVQAISLYFSEPFFPFEDEFSIDTSQSIAFFVETSSDAVWSPSVDSITTPNVPSPFSKYSPKINFSNTMFQNMKFTNSSVPLNFAIDKAVSKIAYCLDGQNNVTITGNTTLPGLPNGQHNVTIYATDIKGRVGESETLFFKVEVPEFPIVSLTVASILTVVIIVVSVSLVYFRRRKKKP